MGMYTQLHLGTRLKENCDENVIKILNYMFDSDELDQEPELPDHELFKTPRWKYMLRCDSYYFDYKTTHHFEYDNISKQYWLNITTNLKNYDNEIQKFLSWISPYIDPDSDGEYVGYYRYEEDTVPTLIYFLDFKLKLVAVTVQYEISMR